MHQKPNFQHIRRASASAIDRRDLLGGTFASAAKLFTTVKAWAQGGGTVPLHCVPPLPPGQSVSFAPKPGGPLRLRNSVFELDAAEVARLKKAYSELPKLREKSPDDPRGWHHQASISPYSAATKYFSQRS